MLPTAFRKAAGELRGQQRVPGRRGPVLSEASEITSSDQLVSEDRLGVFLQHSSQATLEQFVLRLKYLPDSLLVFC